MMLQRLRAVSWASHTCIDVRWTHSGGMSCCLQGIDQLTVQIGTFSLDVITQKCPANVVYFPLKEKKNFTGANKMNFYTWKCNVYLRQKHEKDLKYSYRDRLHRTYLKLIIHSFRNWKTIVFCSFVCFQDLVCLLIRNTINIHNEERCQQVVRLLEWQTMYENQRLHDKVDRSPASFKIFKSTFNNH